LAVVDIQVGDNML